MKPYIYLSLIPEALVLSQLAPEDFGKYLAVGTKQRARGHALFFEVDRDFFSDAFAIEDARKRCVAHADGSPKNSVYVAIYKVLENVPMEGLRNLFAVTADGRVLELRPGPYTAESPGPLHLYQEVCPKMPLVASRLDPRDFSRLITTPNQPISLPRVVFCDLILGDLAENPDKGSDENLPYPQIEHLRDCLLEIQGEAEKTTKTVFRAMPDNLVFRTIRSGFFVADQKSFSHYPMPSLEELETNYYDWWRSAQMVTT
ncbi:MAG: hypothetical protein WD490_03995 [Opitutales bacterium]